MPWFIKYPATLLKNNSLKQNRLIFIIFWFRYITFLNFFLFNFDWCLHLIQLFKFNILKERMFLNLLNINPLILIQYQQFPNQISSYIINLLPNLKLTFLNLFKYQVLCQIIKRSLSSIHFIYNAAQSP
jgi:hypothetical protein